MIKIISGTTRIGKTLYTAGDIVEASEDIEARLVQRGAAAYTKAPAVAPAMPKEPEEALTPPAADPNTGEVDLGGMTAKQLKEYAMSLGATKTELGRCHSKAMIIDLIESKEAVASADVQEELPEFGPVDVVV